MSESALLSDAVSNPLIMLVLQLIGAALILVALTLLLGRTGEPTAPRRTVMPLLTLAVGTALSALAWGLRPAPPDAVLVGNDPTAPFGRLLASNPTAAGPARFGDVSVLVDSTPSDRDTASPSARHAYSTQLATLLANALVAVGLAARADAQAMPVADWPSAQVPDYCADRDLLVTVRMPALRLVERDDYALWREPEMVLRWCRTGRTQTQKFRVLERPGDPLPYAQALRSRLLAALRTAPAG